MNYKNVFKDILKAYKLRRKLKITNKGDVDYIGLSSFLIVGVPTRENSFVESVFEESKKLGDIVDSVKEARTELELNPLIVTEVPKRPILRLSSEGGCSARYFSYNIIRKYHFDLCATYRVNENDPNSPIYVYENIKGERMLTAIIAPVRADYIEKNLQKLFKNNEKAD